METKLDSDSYIDAIKKLDGYIDAIKKIGAKNNKTGFNLSIAHDTTLASIYIGNGLAKRYIDLVSDDMVRQWFTIPEDTDSNILKYLTKKNTKKVFKEAIKQCKIFGGSLIFMVIEDGKLPNDPVDKNNIKSIKKLKAFPRTKVQVLDTNYYQDATDEKFGEPEYFTINDGATQMSIHESRCLVFQGEYFPDNELGGVISYNKFWGLSILQAIHEDLEDYGLVQQALFKVLIKCNVGVLKIKGLMDLLRSPDGKAMLDARLVMRALASSVSNDEVLDADESLEILSQNLSGIADVFGKLQDNISGSTGIPSTVLFGTSPKGLSATGDNELRIYYDKVKSNQQDLLLEPLQKLIRYVTISKDNKLTELKEATIDFISLWQQTEEQTVKMRLEQSKIDEVYIANGVLAPDEVRQSRFGNNSYSINTTIEAEIELPEAEEPEAEEPSVRKKTMKDKIVQFFKPKNELDNND